MEVKIQLEAGYNQGLIGLSYNKKKEGRDMSVISEKLACVGGGHDQWLRQVMVWVDLNMPLSWWKQMDKYNYVIATSMDEMMPDFHMIVTQSESTMFTLADRELRQKDFNTQLPPIVLSSLNALLGQIKDCKDRERKSEIINQLYDELPCGYLQKRKLMMSYAQISTIFGQRKAHKLKAWKFFIAELRQQLDHSYLLDKIFKKGKAK